MWLARLQPGRAVVAAGAVLAVGACAFILFGGVLPAVVGAGLLLAAVGEFLFPISYRLNREGAEARSPFYWRRIAWMEVRQVYVGEGEIKLSPLARASRSEAYRGVLLRCEPSDSAAPGAATHEAVLAAVCRFCDAATGN